MALLALEGLGQAALEVLVEAEAAELPVARLVAGPMALRLLALAKAAVAAAAVLMVQTPQLVWAGLVAHMVAAVAVVRLGKRGALERLVM
jgi:hypothetical protein